MAMITKSIFKLNKTSIAYSTKFLLSTKNIRNT